MKKNIAWIVLSVSLAANVFFVGGFVFVRSVAHDRIETRVEAGRQFREARLEQVGLTEDQRKSFQAMVESIRTRSESQREDLGAALADIRAQSEGDTDPEVLAELLKHIVDSRYDMQLAIIDETSTFMSELEPEQRQKFLHFARRTPIFGALGLGFRGQRGGAEMNGRRGPFGRFQGREER
jgi:hypothetical protein